MKWFKIIVTNQQSEDTTYCVQAHDEDDAIDWVVEDTDESEFYLWMGELCTEEEIEECQSKADVIFWGD